MYQQFLIAILFAGFAIGFAGIRRKNSELQSTGFWALSYMCLAVGFVGEALYSVTDNFMVFTPLSDTLIILGALLLSVGLIRFHDHKLPVLALASVFLSTLSVTLWFWFAEKNPNIRTKIGGYGIAALLGIGAWSVRKDISTTIHRLIFMVTVAFSILLLTAIVLGFHVMPQLATTPIISLKVGLEVLHLGSALLGLSIGALFLLASITKITNDLKRKSETDTLTDLNNRRTFEDKANKAIEGAHQSKSSLALIVCNIDHFNRINEKLGRKEGDLILKKLGQKLTELCRPIDFVGRINDDNFAIILQVATSNMARLVAECARTTIRETTLPDTSTKPITASFGIAELQAGESYYDLSLRAENCLINAKNNGRNQVTKCLSEFSYEDLEINEKANLFTGNLNSIQNSKQFAKSLQKV